MGAVSNKQWSLYKRDAIISVRITEKMSFSYSLEGTRKVRCQGVLHDELIVTVKK